MPGETVLVVEDSSAERDFATTALMDAGFFVIPAANAAAALTYPEVKDVSVIVMDSHLAGVDGFEAARMLRQQATTHPVPILLLVPEDQLDRRQELTPRGANALLLKPYDARTLSRKVARLIEEHHLDDLAKQYLENAADTLMESLADKHIKAAVERKTQIIIERCIQNVASAVDQRARAQVSESVTALTAEKEQELVKFTVREVAQSMVEKLAERKVSEAMETVLAEQAERTVKRIADQLLPGSIRERLKDTLNNTLPREIQQRVQRVVEKEGPEIGRQLIATVEETANKVIPRVARELAPEIIEKRFKEIATVQVPQMVRDLVGQELDRQMGQRIEPTLREAQNKLSKRVTMLISIGLVGMFGMLVLIFLAQRGMLPGFK